MRAATGTVVCATVLMIACLWAPCARVPRAVGSHAPPVCWAGQSEILWGSYAYAGLVATLALAWLWLGIASLGAGRGAKSPEPGWEPCPPE